MISRFSAIFITAIALIVFLVTFMGNGGAIHLSHLQSELRALDDANYQLQVKIDRNKEVLDSLTTSPDYLERKAREDLGLGKPDELLYIFSENGLGESGHKDGSHYNGSRAGGDKSIAESNPGGNISARNNSDGGIGENGSSRNTDSSKERGLRGIAADKNSESLED